MDGGKKGLICFNRVLITERTRSFNVSAVIIFFFILAATFCFFSVIATLTVFFIGAGSHSQSC